ncbi:uncharacterized protein LOC125042509 [Penaeus chinensis]|uniref:uncharacterized protein LOC125042509 n=1 Tax=Penaeus chinensis TaxID=139456 RepID=UPI001FB7CDA6|nr:uncharacterized protein LOC125042509 [Penaeus chinensis]
MAEWSEDEVLRFISFYREKRVLWNPRNPNHSNKFLRHEAWVDLASKTGKSVEDCRRKMTCLMSSMRREKGKMKRAGNAKEPDEVYVSPWFAFGSLQFLWEKDKPREISTITEREQGHKAYPREEDQLTFGSGDTGVAESAPNSLPKVKARKKIKLQDQRSDTASQIFTPYAPSSSDDETQDFANFVAKKIRKYDSLTQSAVQHAIMVILLNTDMSLHQEKQSSAQASPRNSYSAHPLFAETPISGMNLSSMIHRNQPPPAFDTPSTSSTTQTKGECVLSPSNSEDEFHLQEAIT